VIPVEPALFATSVTVRVRNEVDVILSQVVPNYNQANKNETFVIALALQYLKVNFNWKCVEPPLAPNESELCTNYELLLA